MSAYDLAEHTQQQVLVLLTRAHRMHRRAARARAGSNERRKCAGQAAYLKACATQLATDKKLAAEMTDVAGWRKLTGTVTALLRKREAMA